MPLDERYQLLAITEPGEEEEEESDRLQGHQSDIGTDKTTMNSKTLVLAFVSIGA